MVQRGRKSQAALAVVSSATTTERSHLASSDLPQPPRHLGKPERDIWHGVFREYDQMTGLAMAVLCSGLEAHQRMRECREIITREGVTRTVGSGKHLKLHPLLAVERDARSAWMQAVKTLGLEL
jgi:P27 family predicted phage terminase small subunit